MIPLAPGRTQRPTEFSFERSAIDEERFGVRTIRAYIASLSDARWVIDTCRNDGTQLLIIRCPTSNLAEVQFLEAEGARLMDTLVYYAADVTASAFPGEMGAVSIRSGTSADRSAIGQVARESFGGYIGHYHADPRLDRKLSDETYVSWAERSAAAPTPTAEVFVAEEENEVIGFVTVRLNSDDGAEVVLNAVLPRARRRGIYRSLLLKALAWARAKGAGQLLISTQITNFAAQRVWCRLGFAPDHALYTFHQWLKNP